jgi:hypothetical protein
MLRDERQLVASAFTGIAASLRGSGGRNSVPRKKRANRLRSADRSDKISGKVRAMRELFGTRKSCNPLQDASLALAAGASTARGQGSRSAAVLSIPHND